MPALIDLTGKRFGSWTVVNRGSKRSHDLHWLCKCDCGTVREVHGNNLRRGKTTNCGCLTPSIISEKVSTHRETIGGKTSSEYIAWMSMRQRCNSPTCSDYPDYGGRGIKVCVRWQEKFENFLDDMGRKPSRCHSMDRIDVNGNYEPGNCRWASPTIQARNKTNSPTVEWEGELVNLADLCDRLGAKRGRVKDRLRLGWTLKAAILAPKNLKRFQAVQFDA